MGVDKSTCASCYCSITSSSCLQYLTLRVYQYFYKKFLSANSVLLLGVAKASLQPTPPQMTVECSQCHLDTACISAQLDNWSAFPIEILTKPNLAWYTVAVYTLPLQWKTHPEPPPPPHFGIFRVDQIESRQSHLLLLSLLLLFNSAVICDGSNGAPNFYSSVKSEPCIGYHYRSLYSIH